MHLPVRLLLCLTFSLVCLTFFSACLPLSAQQACNTPNCTTSAADTEPQHNDGERAVAIVNEFMARHKDLLPCQQNSTAITSYLVAHNLNPLDENSFEKAFKDLRKQGQLKLHAK